MTQDEIQEAARYAYCRGATSESLFHIMWNSQPSASIGWSREELIAFANAVAAHEREPEGKLPEGYTYQKLNPNWSKEMAQPETDWEAIAADQAMTIAMMLCEQEPVAWQVMVEHESMKEFPIKDMAHDWCVQEKLSGSASTYWIRPLYTSPPQRTWVGLTDEEITELRLKTLDAVATNHEVYRAIEAKLKERNT